MREADEVELQFKCFYGLEWIPKYYDDMMETSKDSQPVADPEDDRIDEHAIKFSDWGFEVDRLFEVAYRFYKRNEGKAFHPSFDARNQMNALILQARFGDQDETNTPDIGVLDFVGKRRQYEWTLLKGISRTEAMSKFICNLDEMCPLFKVHTEAIKASTKGDTNDTKSDFPKTDQNNATQNSLGRTCESDERLRAIYSSLRRQTQAQFEKYAEKQIPNDVLEQKQLIRSLQEQYFQQYISQMHPELKNSPSVDSNEITVAGESESRLNSEASGTRMTHVNDSIGAMTTQHNAIHYREQNSTEEIEVPTTTEPIISPPIPSLDDKQRCVDNPSCEKQAKLIEADISSEELNTYECQPNATSSHGLEIDSVQGNPSREQYVELVKLYQNNHPPQIGSFETFPEPKPIRKSHMSRIPIEDINPNISRNRNMENNIPDIAQAVEVPKELFIANSFTAKPIDIAEVKPVISEKDKAGVKIEVEAHQDVLSEHHLPNLPPIPNFDSNHINEVETIAISTKDTAQDQYDISTQILRQTYPASSMQEIQNGREESIQETMDLETFGNDNNTNSMDQVDIPNVVQSGEACESATTWSKRGVTEFKDSLEGDNQGGVYEIKEGVVVVIQVPTYPDGRYIYWEFATDDYDIAFGLDFIYEPYLIQPLAINIYEESDDDEDDIEIMDSTNGTQMTNTYDAEAAMVTEPRLSTDPRSIRNHQLANTITIMPAYRRDSHEEIFAGRHKYPGTGYYLLRFDNTYSVLRSKTLYFRICYFV